MHSKNYYRQFWDKRILFMYFYSRGPKGELALIVTGVVVLVATVLCLCVYCCYKLFADGPHAQAQTTGNYRPRREASEGYFFTGVCHFNSWGEVGNTKGLPPPPPTWAVSQHLPPPPGQHLLAWPGPKVTTPPPLDNTSLSPGQQPPPLRDYAQEGGTHPTAMHSCCLIFTTSQSSRGKVMFSKVSVSYSIHKGWVSLVPCPFWGVGISDTRSLGLLGD